MVLALAVWLGWPAGLGLMSKLAAVAVAAAMGFHLALAMVTQGRIARSKIWLECLGFPLVISSFLYLPTPTGWLLLISGWAWRFLVGNLWRS